MRPKVDRVVMSAVSHGLRSLTSGGGVTSPGAACNMPSSAVLQFHVRFHPIELAPFFCFSHVVTRHPKRCRIHAMEETTNETFCSRHTLPVRATETLSRSFSGPV